MPVFVGVFLQTSYFLIFETPFIELKSKFATLSKPVFRIAFFEKIFEHIIAPQAP
ncbi:MAG: hypothetical protein SFU27_05565 [Thermonemataceae bacterium]|nr:hypothetical protein [Thermonemataceae bacterium]